MIVVLLIACLYSVYAQSTTTLLNNHQITSSSVSVGSYTYFYFTLSSSTQLFARDYPTIYLTTTTCSQPQSSDFNEQVPPLQVYVSTSRSNTLPGPHQGITVEDGLNGLTQWQSDGTSSELWIAVGGPSLQGSWTGNWTFEIGISTHQPMHVVYTNNMPYLLLDDTDRNNALFLSSPFSGTAPNTSLLIASHLPTELSYSFCAIRLNTVANYAVNTTTTTRGFTNTTKQQFMVSNLVQDTTYTAYMTQTTQGLTGITMPVSVTTKMDANCRIIYDLPFCNQVAYSVPINPDTFNTDNQWDLAYQYDTQALEKFEPFSIALSQFNCETTQYSLVRNCTDCYRDYKTWLCSVTIPRCTDASSSGDLTQGTDDVVAAPALRDISVNASRNPWVDDTLNPGEWTELLPCIDLCYHVVQSCPPFMQFYCPTGDLATVQYGYWQYGTVYVNGSTYQFDVNNPTCNRMGVDPNQLVIISAASTLSLSRILFVCIFLCFIVL